MTTPTSTKPPSGERSVARRGRLLARLSISLEEALLTRYLWGTAAVADLVLAAFGEVLPLTPLRVGCTYGCGFAISLLMTRLTQGRRGSHDRRFSLPRLLLLAASCGSMLFVIDVLARAYVHGGSEAFHHPGPFFDRRRSSWSYFFLLFFSQFAMAWLAANAREIRAREQSLAGANLLALRLQLNPHFLSNSLNSVISLLRDGETVRSERMLLLLDDFLRLTLAADAALAVPLADELDLLQAYLAIEATRFEGRLRPTYDCAAGLGDAMVPVMILQPLVENAVKHALSKSGAEVEVVIRAFARNGRLVLQVTDDGAATGGVGSSSGGRLGLDNIRSRLAALHGNDAWLRTEVLDRGFRASIQMPLMVRSGAPGEAARGAPPAAGCGGRSRPCDDRAERPCSGRGQNDGSDAIRSAKHRARGAGTASLRAKARYLDRGTPTVSHLPL